MKLEKAIIAVVGSTAVVAGLGGCVESEASLAIRGVVEFNGSRSVESVECPVEGQEEPEERSMPILNCGTGVQGGSAQNFLGGATINVDDFTQEGGPGQIGGTSNASVGEDQFCDVGASEFVQKKYGSGAFELTIDSWNRLEDSREVEAEGESSGGGGFEGLHLNTNDIHLRNLRIRFPDSSASALEQEIRLATLVESGGGGATVTFTLLDRSDGDVLDAVYEQESGDGNAATITAEFVMKGETLGEREVESNRFEFPIRLCKGEQCATTPRCRLSTDGAGGAGGSY